MKSAKATFIVLAAGLLLSSVSVTHAAAVETSAKYEAKPPQLRVSLSQSSIKVGDTFEAAIWLQGALGEYRGVEGVEFKIKYDPKLVQPQFADQTGKLQGGLFSETNKPITWANSIDKEGTIKFAQSLPPKSTEGFISGNAKIGVIQFKALKDGGASFTVSDTILIMPGNVGVNIKHSHNNPSVGIGSAKAEADKVVTVGSNPKPASISRSAEDVIQSFADAKDFSSVSWSKEAVAALTDYGVLQGLPDGTFSPKKKMTRAEFAQMAVIAFGLDMQHHTTPTFTDIKNIDWYYDAVETAASYGIISGYTNPSGEKVYKPGNGITRAEISSILSKYLIKVKNQPSKANSGDGQFKDVKDNLWARQDILNLYHYGIISGTSKDRFSPDANATRAEVTVMLHKMLSLKQ